MGFMIIYNIYNQNKDFREYVSRYCRKHHVSVDEALQHKLVQEVGYQYMQREGGAL